MTAAAVTGISLCLYLSGAAAALWSSDQAVHVNGNEIENSTLVIGTHLIHLSALTEELYDIALKSAEDSMQNQIYYKSELAGGTWFDITSASGLEDISTAGSPVAVEEIEGLFFEYHTKSDGVTYDLRTEKPVNIFDIRDPYNLEAMEELQPAKLQYDMLEEKEELGDKDQWCKDRLTDFFKTDTVEESVTVVNEETGESTVYAGADTKELDQALEKLQNYLNVLNQYDAGSSEKDEVSAVMASVDASRRLIVYEIVYDLTYQLMETYTGTNGKLPEEYQVDAELTDAVNESLGNLNDAIIETEGKVRTEGNTVLSMEIYRWSNQLVEDAKADNMAACDTDVEKLLALKNITDGTIEKQQVELNLLEESLLASAAGRYLSGLGGGENSEYLTAKAGNAAGVMLDSIAENYGNQVNTFRNELEFLVDAKCMRLGNTEAQEYIKTCIEEASGYYGGIPSDGFYGNCKLSLDGYIKWLNEKLSSLVQGGGGTETDSLKAEKEELQEQYMAALDNNNLEKALELEKKIDEADGKIKALDSAQAAEYAGLETEIDALKEKLEAAVANGGQGQEALAKELAGKQAQAAELKSRMSGESAGTQAVKIKQEAVSAVTKNPGAAELSQVEGGIDALGAMLDSDYKAVFPQLTQVYSQMTRERDLNGSGSYDRLIEKTEELILNNKAAFDAAMADQVTSDEMMAAAEEFFGTGEDGWSEEQSVVFMAAGEMYLENALGMGGGSGNQSGDGSGNGSLGGAAGDENGGQSGDKSGSIEDDETESGDKKDNKDGNNIESGDNGDTGSGTDGQSGDGNGTDGQSGAGAGSEGEGQSGDGSGTGGQSGTGNGTGGGQSGAEDQSGNGSGTGQNGTAGSGSIGISSAALTGELKEIASMLDAKAVDEYLSGNALVYLKLSDPAAKYIPVPVLGNYLNMRYLWNKPKNQATLALGSRYYEFTLFSNQVKTGKSEAEEITIVNAPKIKTVLYIPEDFTSREFGCSAVYLPGSDYAVLCPDELKPQVEELFGIMMEGGG